MQNFNGFPPGSLAGTPIPNLFFGSLLPEIGDLAELKLTLHVLWRLHQEKGFPRYLTKRSLRDDGLLLHGLQTAGSEPSQTLDQALQRAVERGTLLALQVEIGGASEVIYLLNDGKGREAVEKLRRGEIGLGGRPVVVEPVAAPKPTQSSIYTLYEQNIGLLTPLIVEDLAEAERVYPADWITDAFRVAVQYNRRNWRYIRRILERWAIEGKKG